jgi:methyl-accepting chemotaxis protein/hemerythrin
LDLQTQYRAGKASLTIEVLNFLKDWLVNHIQGVDRKTFLA